MRGQERRDLFVGRFRVRLEEVRNGDQDSGRAESALQAMMFVKGLLDGVDSEEFAPAAELVALDRRVTAEDKEMLDTTDPGLPLDLRDEVHVRADRSTIEYRRFLARIHASAMSPAY
jgi:hypothetical protein